MFLGWKPPGGFYFCGSKFCLLTDPAPSKTSFMVPKVAEIFLFVLRAVRQSGLRLIFQSEKILSTHLSDLVIFVRYLGLQ